MFVQVVFGSRNIHQRVKEGAEVCEALRKLMEPEMEQAITKAVEEAVKQAVSEKDAVIADQSERIKQLEEELANATKQ